MRNTVILIVFAVSIALTTSFAQQSTAPSATPAKKATTSTAPKTATKTGTATAAKKAAAKDAEPAKPDPAIEAGQKALKMLQEQDKKRKDAIELTHEYLRRWNNLDGKPETTNALVEMFTPDALLEIGPNERQGSGAITYEGQKLIRRWAENYSKQYSAIHYLVTNRTVKETTIELIQTAEAPWGSTQIAMELTGGQTDKVKDKRYMLRGSAFFEVANGKFTRVRVYTPRDEMLEITGPRSASN